MIAIHHRPGSFSEKWVEYCQENKLDYKLVDCYSSSIMEEISECDIVMWHWPHYDYESCLFAKALIQSLEISGKTVFPSIATCWHFDDKLAQKYMFEAIEAPFIPTNAFYRKADALSWAMKASFPKVFKLRGGAGSENVKLVRSFAQAKKVINKAFSKGFKVKSRLNFLKERIWYFRRDPGIKSFFNISKGIGRLVIPSKEELASQREKRYVYFQDFVPDNNHDIRVIVIGKRAFAVKRMVREGDFRASGSGVLFFDPSEIPLSCISLSFDLTTKLGSQCAAYDFVFLDGRPLVVEVSYSYTRKAYESCPGYWNDNLEWVPGSFQSEYFMVEDVVEKARGISGVRNV